MSYCTITFLSPYLRFAVGMHPLYHTFYSHVVVQNPRVLTQGFSRLLKAHVVMSWQCQLIVLALMS